MDVNLGVTDVWGFGGGFLLAEGSFALLVLCIVLAMWAQVCEG